MNGLLRKIFFILVLAVGFSYANEDVEASPFSEPQALDCVFSQDFWRQHPEEWPASFNPEAMKLGDILWTTILTTPSNGRPWYVLARQYIVAELNGVNDFKASEEFSIAVGYCQALLESNEPENINPENRDAFFSLAALLDDFNAGLLGNGYPEQCLGEDNLVIVETFINVCPPLDCPACPSLECPVCQVMECEPCHCASTVDIKQPSVFKPKFTRGKGVKR